MGCKEEILAVFEGKLKESDINKLFVELDEAKQLNPSITEKELMENLISKRRSYLHKKMRLLKQIELGDANAAYIDRAVKIDGVSTSNMKDMLLGFISRNGKYQRENLESTFTSTFNEYLNVFSGLEKKEFFKILRDKKASPEFFKEVAQGVWAKSNNMPVKFKFTESVEAVDLIHGLNKKRLLDLQNAGYDIQNLNGYVFSGSYDPQIVRGSGLAGFKKDLYSTIDMHAQAKKWGLRMNPDGSPSKEFEEMVDAIYNDIIMSDRGEIGGLDNLDKAMKDLKNPDRLNSMVSAHRVFAFKDGEGFYSFFEKYSGNNMMEALYRDAKRTARTVAKTSVFGTAPDLGIDQIINAANKHLVNAGKEVLDKKFVNDYRAIVDMALGQGLVTDNLIVRTTNVLKQFSSMALLGKAAVKALLTDPVMAANVLGTLTRDNYYAAMAKYMVEYGKTISSSAYKDEIGKRANILIKEAIVEMMQEKQGISGFERGLSKMHNAYMKVSGIKFQSLRARTAAAKIVLHHMSDILEGRVAKDIAEKDIANLKLWGFDDRDLTLMQKAHIDLEGTRILDPSVIRDMDTQAIREALGNPTREVTKFIQDSTVKDLEKEYMAAVQNLKNIEYRVGTTEQINYAQKLLDEAKGERAKILKDLAESPLGKQVEELRIQKQRLFARSKILKEEEMRGLHSSGEARTKLMADLAKTRSLFSQAEASLKNSALYKTAKDIEPQIVQRRQYRNELYNKLGGGEEILAQREIVRKVKESWEAAKEALAAEGTGDKVAITEQVALSDNELIGIARRTSQKIGTYANDYAMMASPNPTAVIKYKMAGMYDPSTPAGALVSLLTQFKAFGASVYRVYRNAAWHDGVAETNKFKQYIFGGRSAMAHTILTGTVIGAGVNMLTDVLDGKIPRDPTADPINFLNDAIMASGTGGLYADYLLEDYEQGKKDVAKDVLGPVAGRMLPDAVGVYEEIQKAIHGEDHKTMETAVNKLVRWMPGQNLFFGKAALDMLLLDSMRQWADPMHERKKMKFMQERSGALWEQAPIYED